MKILNFPLIFLSVFTLAIYFTSCTSNTDELQVTESVNEEPFGSTFTLQGEIVSSIYDMDRLRSLLFEKITKNTNNDLEISQWKEIIFHEKIEVIQVRNQHFLILEWIDNNTQVKNGLRSELVQSDNRLDVEISDSAPCRSSGCSCEDNCDCLFPTIPNGWCQPAT